MLAEIENPLIKIGGNNPPVAEALASRYEADLVEFDELIAAAKTVPLEIKDDDTQAKAGEIVKKIRALKSHFTNKKDEETAPHEVVLTAIKGFFTFRIDPLEEQRKRITEITKKYSDMKAAQKARELAEAAERKRQEEERLLKLAQDAERTANAEKQALADLQRLNEEAANAKEAAMTQLEQAQADVAEAERDLAKVKYEIATKAHEFAERAKKGTPATDDEKAAARAQSDTALGEAKSKLADAKGNLEAARQRAREAKAEQQRLDDEERAKQRAVNAAQRDAAQNLKEATKEATGAQRLEAKATSGDADLGRTRSEHGAVITTSKRWECTLVDRNLVDKEKLWPFINEDAISAAAFKWMMAQAADSRSMLGTIMEEVTIGQVR